MDRIQAQANKLWQLIFAAETGQTYQKTLSLTWEILKESAQLIWLLLCLVLVLGTWIGMSTVQTGKNLKIWYQNLSTEVNPSDDGDGSAVFNSAGKALLEASSSSVAYLLSQAKEQLGIQDDIVVKAIEPASPTVEPPAVDKSSPVEPSTPAAAPPAVEPLPAVKSVVESLDETEPAPLDLEDEA